MQRQKLYPHYIAGLVDGEGCFDLQFRRDVRHERPGSPVYYGWKAQFVINLRGDDAPLLEKVQQTLGYGTLHYPEGFVRYSVQDIQTLYQRIVPFFKTYPLQGKKQKDFALWAEAIEILFRNRNINNTRKGKRGFTHTQWKRMDFQRLIKLHKEMQQYKSKRKRGVKWMNAAEAYALALPEQL